MIVLGINAFGHDAAAVLLADGEPVFAASEERFDRNRHSAAFPVGAIRAALAHARLEPRDVDRIAFPWSRDMGRLKKLIHVLRRLPRSSAYFREPPDTLLPDRRGYLRDMARVGRRLREEGFDAPLRRIPHHRAHAASARLALPDQRGAVLTADGMGEWTTAASWDATSERLRRVDRAEYPHSPGKVYAAVTAWLGFRPESDEGKTMGLAAYGSQATAAYRFARELLAPRSRALLEVPVERFGFPWGEARLYGDAFLDTLGPARQRDDALRDQDADVALGVQRAVEAFGVDAARRILAQSEAESIGLAGGLFLNCAMNGHLARTLDVPVRPFPVAGDAGAAWGAAALVHARERGRAASPLTTLRLGTPIHAAEVRALLRGVPGTQPFDEVNALADAVAAELVAGRVIGVARDRAEFGPRALGARSVIAHPTSEARRDDVNARKGREAWRPLAPIVREGDDRWFERQTPSPWMILTFHATELAQREVPGVVHADGTARVQTVTPTSAPFIHAVLDALEARGHPAVIINTSLNRRGEPIVDTAHQALVAGRAMGLDAMVLANTLVPLVGSSPQQ